MLYGLVHRLLKYGQSFMHNSSGGNSMDVETVPLRSDIELWDRTTIWSNFPELSYTEMMESDSGLRHWLDIFYKVSITKNVHLPSYTFDALFPPGSPIEVLAMAEVNYIYIRLCKTKFFFYGQIYIYLFCPLTKFPFK